MLLAAVLAVLLAAAEAALERPAYFKPCSRNDPDLDACALKNGIEAVPFLLKGDRKYKIPVVDPLKITEIRIDDANKGSSATGLNIFLRDLTVYGLDKVQLKKVHFDLQKKEVEIVLAIPSLRLKSQYEIDGKILVLPIKGKGDGNINMTDVDITYWLKYDLVTKPDGLEYMKAGDSKLVHKTKNMHMYLDNLFNGDKTLGENTNSFLNENWEVLNTEIGPFIAQAIGEAIKQIIANCMDLIPYNVLFPEEV
ncbi:protein takeout-like [Bacillus rossius redtenbacheri]|uniref:protein takeout-like n=1 Tax=Bacillus rossius redtenbacheri TaxID=93214 RepID=UPI002FDD9104